uniref:Uncharacterized protein n=1 Tax=Tanacetum cinerariifolium TaxID=118510 RepID=A0A6L2LA11_TANCI|nr:hypothetical protein [Tanacetum cinerariifolium]
MSLLQEVLDACAALTKNVKHLEYDKVAQALEILKLKKKRIDTSEDTMMEDASNQGRMIDDLDKDDVVALMDDKEEEKKEKEEVADVVTTAKLITKVVTTASETVTAASTTVSAAELQVPAATTTAPPQQVEMDEEYARKLYEDLNKDIDWDVAIEHVKQKAKEDPAVQRYQAMKRKPLTEAQARRNMIMYLKNITDFRLDYFKGMSYDDIRLIFEVKFNSNVDFILKTKEHMEEEERRAIQSINETPAQKAAKRKKLNEEVEDLKRHLEIMPDEDDDTRWTSSSLEESNDCLWSSEVERRYPLSRFTLDQMLNAVRLRVEEQSEIFLELLSFGVDAAINLKEKHQVFNAAGEELSAVKQKLMLLD